MKRSIQAASMVAGLLLMAVTAFAQSVEDGAAAYRAGDMQTAFEIFTKHASEGDSIAQHNLGYMYENGGGVRKSLRHAYDWYEKAAEQGHVHSMYKASYAYAIGEGRERDLDIQREWLYRAAERGHGAAFNNLSVIYSDGRGVPKDLVKAYMLARLGADMGDGIAGLQLESYNLPSLMTPRQIAEANRRADAWRVGMPLPR